MADDRTLFCRVPPHEDGNGLVEVFTKTAKRYRHSIRYQGGFWEASWMFSTDNVNRAHLLDWYENRLMFRHEERVGGQISWEGVIWNMVLTLDGYRERRSVASIYNAISTLYTDNTDTSQQTSWYTNDSSINRYGRRELLLELDNVDAAQAQNEAQNRLRFTAEPYPELVGINKAWPDSLQVTAVGDIFTANNRYVTAATGTTFDGRISNILSTDCDYLSAGNIVSNSMTPEDLTIDSRAWDVLLELTEAGDASNPYRLWVEPGGLVWYQVSDNTPLYEWTGRPTGLVNRIGGSSPWLVKPGVIRNMTRKTGTPVPGTFLDDVRDSWVAEVEMADGWSDAVLKPDTVGPDDIATKTAMYLAWLEKGE